MNSRLNSISEHSLKLYTQFYEVSGIIVQGESQLIKAISSLIPKHYKTNSKNCLIITSDVKKSSDVFYRTPEQFLYDIEVFNEIPLEIAHRMKKNCFRKFCTESMEKMKKNGWKIVFLEKNFTSSFISCSDDSLEFLCSESKAEEKMLVVINSCEQDFKNFYEMNKEHSRIEKKYFLEFIIEYTVVCLYEYIKSILEPKGVFVCLTNWSWSHNHVLFQKEKITSSYIEKRKHFSIYEIAGNEERYIQFLEEIYGKRNSDFYREIFDIPPKIQIEPGFIQHKDCTGNFLNVLAGERLTTDYKSDAKNSVYLFGGCVFFGYAESDENTVASFLQRKLNECGYKYNTKNYGTWGGYSIEHTEKSAI